MLVRMYIVITENELVAIQSLANKELRTTREQIHFMLRENLSRLGLLPDDKEKDKTDAGIDL